jgi:hypothetical protein
VQYEMCRVFDKFVRFAIRHGSDVLICKYTCRVWSVAMGKVWCIRTANSEVCRPCVAVTMTRGRGLETSPIAVRFGNEVSSHSEETKKVRR